MKSKKTTNLTSQLPVPSEFIERRILKFRNHRVMVDSDLATLYGVSTKRLNEAVSRNLDRFPVDFMFRLNATEAAILRSQFATSSLSHGGRRNLPRVFTEQGVAMLSSVLRSRRAIQVNIAIMRAFVRLRELLLSHKELSEKLSALERRYNANFKAVFTAIRHLMKKAKDPDPPSERIGFK